MSPQKGPPGSCRWGRGVILVSCVAIDPRMPTARARGALISCVAFDLSYVHAEPGRSTLDFTEKADIVAACTIQARSAGRCSVSRMKGVVKKRSGMRHFRCYDGIRYTPTDYTSN